MGTFKEFNLENHIVAAVEKIGFKRPTTVQERVIPTVLSGKNIIGQSQTGTGKTHAFLLPVLAKITVTVMEVQAVIVAPTRELANQIYQVAVQLNELFPNEKQLQIRSFIGGADKQRMIAGLKTQPQLVIGTPGRIKELVQVNALNVYTASQLIVDEADLMIDLGFMEEVDFLAARMAKQLQILVFSATIPEKLQPFLKKYMENPKHIEVDATKASSMKIEHILVPAKHRDQAVLIKQILQRLNPYLALIFTNSKKQVDELADALLEKGIQVGKIHGDLPPRERKRAMKEITDLKYQYVVASDLAARGIDITGVSHVINAEIPQDLDFYIHRTGRTGRASFSGIAITLYMDGDESAIRKLEERGIQFTYKDIVKGDWIDIKERNSRRLRKKPQITRNAEKAVSKPKAVKPGYKKKLAAKKAEEKTKAQRSYNKQKTKEIKK